MGDVRRCAVAVLAALLALSLAACGGSGADSPPPSPTVSFPDDPYQAPTVPDPIYADAFVEKPCTSLTPDQQKKHHLDGGTQEPPGHPDPVRIRDTCFYSYTNGDRWIRIAYDNGGLQGHYNYGPTGQKRWEPQVLDGHPALAKYLEDRRGVPSYPPSCYYVVGVNDFLDFSVLAQDADGSSECGLARSVAADVLSTLRNNRPS
jgi:Protein of unknown function (DUF3558)